MHRISSSKYLHFLFLLKMSKLLLLIWTLSSLRVLHGFPVENNQVKPANETSPSVCPCAWQPEGTKMAHASDCQAFYTCLGSSNVSLGRCENEDSFFHTSTGTCIPRSKFTSFIPLLIPTKDMCHIKTIFKIPKKENFTSCHISNSNEEQIVGDNSKRNEASPSATNLNTMASNTTQSYAFPVAQRNYTLPDAHSNMDVNLNSIQPNRTLSSSLDVGQLTTSGIKIQNPPNPSSSTSNLSECQVSKVVVHHFPPPCQATITCANGINFRIGNCQNSLSLTSL